MRYRLICVVAVASIALVTSLLCGSTQAEEVTGTISLERRVLNTRPQLIQITVSEPVTMQRFVQHYGLPAETVAQFVNREVIDSQLLCEVGGYTSDGQLPFPSDRTQLALTVAAIVDPRYRVPVGVSPCQGLAGRTVQAIVAEYSVIVTLETGEKYLLGKHLSLDDPLVLGID